MEASRVFVLLEAGAPPPEWIELVRRLEVITGGVADALPHLTAASGRGNARVKRVLAAVRAAVDSRHGPISVRVLPRPDYGPNPAAPYRWGISATVETCAALDGWGAAAAGALRSAGLAVVSVVRTWPHVTLVRGSAQRPSLDADLQRAAAAAAADAGEITLTLDRLRVTRLAAGTFVTLGEMGIGAACGARKPNAQPRADV